jgi:effector-binding domain-containing protein
MKKILYLSVCSLLLLVFGCYDREILDSKEGESIDPVTNLSYIVNGDQVTLMWDLPSHYPDDIVQPASVFIDIFKDGINISSLTLGGAPTTCTIGSYSPSSTFRYIVKVFAYVNTTDPNMSGSRYSLGEVVVIE